MSKSFSITYFTFCISNFVSPFFIVNINHILNLEFSSICQIFIISECEKLLANTVCVIKVNHFDNFFTGFRIVSLSAFAFSFSLSTQICHKFGHHVTNNLHVLIIDFLLQVIKTCLDNVSIQLSGNEKLRKKVHISVHLLLLSLFQLIVVKQVHHWLRETVIVFGVVFAESAVETLSSYFTFFSFFV